MNMTDFSAQVSQLKESLLAQKSLILNKRHNFVEDELSPSHLADESDVAANEASNNISIHLQERDRKALFQIEKALCKIENGTYGECSDCGQKISAGRLIARPFTDLCIDCMEDQESKNSPIQ